MRNLNCVLLSVLFFFIPMAALAGDLDSPAAPTSAGSAMYTLEAIYNRLNAGTAGAKRAGAFTEPSSGPTAGTGRTLDEVMGKAPSVDAANGAGVADVLADKTFWGLKTGGWGLLTGTMSTNTLSADNDTVAAGYYAATTLSAVDSDLAGGNIVSGKTIFGVEGTVEDTDAVWFNTNKGAIYYADYDDDDGVYCYTVVVSKTSAGNMPWYDAMVEFDSSYLHLGVRDWGLLTYVQIHLVFPISNTPWPPAWTSTPAGPLDLSGGYNRAMRIYNGTSAPIGDHTATLPGRIIRVEGGTD